MNARVEETKGSERKVSKSNEIL